MSETSKLTYSQLEESLLQGLIDLYLTQLGHQINKVSYRLVDQTLTIVVEDSITSPEKLLVSNGQKELAKQVRLKIHQAFQSHLKALIERVVQVPVIDLLSDSAFDTGNTSIVAILAATPQVGNLC